jgi:hypothetical protein
MFEEIKATRKPDGRCPQCGHRQREVRLDLDACELECTHCQTRFSPTTVFTDRQILTRLQHLSLEAQETVLSRLGFEKRPAPRTRKPFLYAIAVFYILVLLAGAVGCIRTGEDVLYCIMAILGIPVLCFKLYPLYKGEAKSYYWRRRQQM